MLCSEVSILSSDRVAVERRTQAVSLGARAVSPRSREIGPGVPVDGLGKLEGGRRARVAAVGGASQVSLYFFFFGVRVDVIRIVSFLYHQ